MDSTWQSDMGVAVGDDRSERFHRRAAAAVQAGAEGWRHITVEYTAGVDEIIDTLGPQGPYAYTVVPIVDGAGRLRQRIAVTRDAIRDAYVDLHAQVRMTRWRSVTEVRADWYSFHHGLADIAVEATDDHLEFESLVFFPTMGESGITGELFWARQHPSSVGDDGLEDLALRLELLAQHDRLLGAYRLGDPGAAVAEVDHDAQVAVRDYVADTGTLVELDGVDALHDHLTQFFGRYEVVQVEVVRRHVEDWFVFAELWWLLRPRGGDGSLVGCVTADFAEISPRRAVVARIGHGTRLIPA